MWSLDSTDASDDGDDGDDGGEQQAAPLRSLEGHTRHPGPGGSGVNFALFWGHFRSNRILLYSACILVVSVLYPNIFEDTCIYLRIFVVF